MIFLHLCEPGAGEIEQDDYGKPYGAYDGEAVAVGLTVWRVVEEDGAVKEPAYGLMRGECEKSRGEVDCVEMQDIEEERDAAVGFKDAAEPAA